MPSTKGVWGIDIGQCALKALRCEYDPSEQKLVATAFDYIEHPKILSQPDANPKELIREALAQFLSRNNVRGDEIAVSVPGQNGLARFFQPPPVDSKRLPEIVRFEARQQIPFPLNDVIWDYQLMGGAIEEEGFLMEAEIGLFAMKRDQVYEVLQPFLEADVEVHHLQLAPLCAYNFVTFNLLTEELEQEIYDADAPPDSYVVLNLGTDTTDLVVTNGFRVWQRNVPLGGNHFTKQLTKELKLTFAKAEHLKRNVRDAEDAKAVVQAMRPVFNDLLTEVQRSIGFFQNIDRRAQIGGILVMGNAVKLPGLQQYLAKNLGYSLVDLDQAAWAARLTGSSVLSSPQFKENMHAFGLCYGLCLQGLGQGQLATNLLPKEIATQRLIRAKKPWAVATAAALMLAFAVNFFFEYNEWYKVHPGMQHGELTWEQAMSDVSSVQTMSSQFDQEDQRRVQRLEELVALGNELSGDSDRRLLWLELLKAINRALPRTEGIEPGQVPDPTEVPISQRKELNIEYIESQYFSDLASWFTEPVRRRYMEEMARWEGVVPASDQEPGSGAPVGAAEDEGEAEDGGRDDDLEANDFEANDFEADAELDEEADAEVEDAEPEEEMFEAELDIEIDELGLPEVTGPEGPGWVIELRGHHFHNEDPLTWGGTHVRDTFLRNLREMTIELPLGPEGEMESFTMEELGIGYAILALETRIEHNHRVPNPYYEPPVRQTRPGAADPRGAPGRTGGLGGTRGGLGARSGAAQPAAEAPREEVGENGIDPDNPPFFVAPRYTFVVQFCWQERLLTERLRAREQALMQPVQDEMDEWDDLGDAAPGDSPDTPPGA